MKRSRSGSRWLQTRGLNTKEKVEQFASQDASQGLIAIGEWNNEHPDDTIEVGAKLEEAPDAHEGAPEEQEPEVAKQSSRKQRRKLEKSQKEERQQQQKAAAKLEVSISESSWQHILQHIDDDLSKSLQGIYLAQTKGDILVLINEAVGEWVSKTSRVLAREARRHGASQAFVVDMQRKIGIMGGSQGGGADARYLRVEITPGRGKTVVNNAFPAHTLELKH